MNDVLTTEDVEDRLRRTLTTRAEDMAPGDGQAWEGADVVHIVPMWAAPASRRGGRPSRRVVLAAALLLVVAGTAVALTLADEDNTGAPQDQGPGPTLTDSTAPPPDDAPSTVEDPNTNMYGIGEFAGDGHSIHAQFEPRSMNDGTPPTDFWQPVTAGSHTGWYAGMPDAGISELWVVFDDGVVVLRGGDLPREQLLAAGATVTFDPETGRYTMPAPPGWTTVSEPGPDVPVETGPLQLPVDLGFFTRPADPNVNYAVIWYEGWDASDVAPNAEAVQVGDREGYVGSIAPDAEGLLQLWIVYDDGVVELQAAGLSRDELMNAGTGVTRPDGGDFTVTPAPGFERG